MLNLPIGRSAEPVVLCIGAHCDDIEIGCGATLSEIARACPGARFHCWIFSSTPSRLDESTRCLSILLGGTERLDLRAVQHRDSYFPNEWGAIKEELHDMSRTVSPDLIFSHSTQDLHQDHRTLAELTWNTFRDHLILEYEIMKFDGDLGRPNVYFPLEGSRVDAKVDALLSAFRSQRDKPWFTRQTFEAIARIRGVECNSPSGLAEAFTARKLTIGVPR